MIWPEAERHILSESLNTLGRVEGVAFGKPARSAPFRQFGRFLVRERAMSASDWKRANAVSGRPAGFWRLLWPFSTRLEINSSAAFILLKSNIRAAYPGLGLTLKISNPQAPKSRQRIAGEARVRGLLRHTEHVAVPKILSQGSAFGESYLCEELLDGVGSPSRKEILTAFAPALVGFLRNNGIESSDRTGDIDPGRTILEFRAAAMRHGLRLPARVDSRLAGLAGDVPASLPRSLCHGDLGRSNILVRDGQFFIVDWEFAREAPSLIDAVRLATQFPGFAQAFLKAHDKTSSIPQYILASLEFANEHVRRLERGVHMPRSGDMRTRDAARKLTGFISLIEHLCRLEEA